MFTTPPWRYAATAACALSSEPARAHAAEPAAHGHILHVEELQRRAHAGAPNGELYTQMSNATAARAPALRRRR